LIACTSMVASCIKSVRRSPFLSFMALIIVVT